MPWNLPMIRIFDRETRNDRASSTRKYFTTLLLLEMLERFSYYGMRSLLIFYLTKAMLKSDREAAWVYGTYTSLIFITPLLGGYLADRYLGLRKAILFGGGAIAAGHLLLGLGSGPDSAAPNVFRMGLGFIILGTGFLKPGIATVVGQLYRHDERECDAAYTLFYMAANVGGLLGPLICGLLGETLGWSWGFGAAALGMIAGMVAFAIRAPVLHGIGDPPDRALLNRPVLRMVQLEWVIYAACLAGVPGLGLLLAQHDTVGMLLAGASIMVIAYLGWECVFRLKRSERDPLLAALFLIGLNPLFWSLYEQAGSSLNLYIDRHADRTLWGVPLPASLFQSVNALYLIVLAPLLSALWLALGKRGREPSTPAKMGLALIQLGIGFLILVAGAAAFGPERPTPILFVFALLFWHTTAELCFSPIGLSAMSKLAPDRMAGLVMSVWFLATAAGIFIAGQIAAGIGGVPSSPAHGPAATLSVYRNVAALSIAAGLCVLILSPGIRRLMDRRTVRDTEPGTDS